MILTASGSGSLLVRILGYVSGTYAAAQACPMPRPRSRLLCCRMTKDWPGLAISLLIPSRV